MADLKSTVEVTDTSSYHENVSPSQNHEESSHKESALDSTILNAKLATDKEHRMTLLQGVKLYPKAVFWSVLISTCIVMEGYDISLINNFYAFETFNRKYGVEIAPGKFQVPAAWQAGLSNGANVGEIIGLFINGFISERFGYR
jgi:SP family general alpha glucoside:H+ symporter-like MFS transporter